MSTVAEAIHHATRRLEAAAGEDARLEAEVLLAHTVRTDRTHVLARLHKELAQDDERAFAQLVDRRRAHEPLAYIVGYREFYGLNIVCRGDALIPRPETEMLVDLALEEIERCGADIRIVDVGTGSGAVAVAIGVNAPNVRLTATDASDDALAVAAENLHTHGLDDRVRLLHTDLFEGAGEFDLILANLPYVSEHDWATLQPEIREHEPRAALIGGPNGTEVIERLIAHAPSHLAPNGMLAAEIGGTQGERLLTVASQFFPDARAYVMKDFAGRDRVLVIRTEGEGIG